MKFWIQTFSGGQIDLRDPKPEQYTLLDIAHSLSRQCRYAGHSRWHTPVADHCVRVSDLVLNETMSLRLAWAALVHDVPETAVGDVSGPMKMAMRAVAMAEGRQRSHFDVIEERHVHACEAKLLVGGSAADRAIVKLADVRDLIAERNVNFGPPPQEWAASAEPHDIAVSSSSSYLATRERWLRKAAALAPTVALSLEASEALKSTL